MFEVNFIHKECEVVVTVTVHVVKELEESGARRQKVTLVEASSHEL